MRILNIEKVHNLKAQAGLFMNLFGQIAIALFGIIVVWLAITLIVKYRNRDIMKYRI